MKLSIRDGMWVFKCDQGERLAPKDAGFWFHGSSPCRREGHCSPCEKGVEWAWWLPDLPRYTDCAVRLRDYADDGARARIETYLNSLDESRPTGPDSDIVIPVPEGRDPLNFLRELRDRVYRDVNQGLYQSDPHYCYEHETGRKTEPERTDKWFHLIVVAERQAWCVEGLGIVYKDSLAQQQAE